MAIKINTAYKEILTSSMLNEKISGVVGGNEKVNGFDVSISTPTSVSVTPGKAYVNGCSIEETSDTRTITLGEDILSNDGVAYIGLVYTHETKNVEFSCLNKINSNTVKLATVTIKNGVIAELINHSNISTLNTVIGASADLEAQKIRDSIHSGFIKLGQLDYDFMSTNENKVKIKDKSIAYVSGYRIEIPANTVIDIGEAPDTKSREDLLFLEAWKDSDFAKNGKLKWRIRHIADVNFNRKFQRGGHIGYIGWNDGLQFSKVYAIGANPQRTQPLGIDGIEIFRDAVNEWRTVHNLQDYGLWIAGDGEKTKDFYNTIDGYVYAIPMFRVYRKPSCGKSAPFEYSKISPKADYRKFTHLINEERVERVTKETIYGRSLLNLATPSRVAAAGSSAGTTISPIVNGYRFQKSNTNTFYPKYILKQALIKPLTTYTIYYRIKTSFFGALGFCIAYGDSYLNKNPASGSVLYNSEIAFGTERIVSHTFTTSNATQVMDEIAIGFTALTGATDWCEITNLMLLEGDWSNKKAPEFFIGLKSVGEDDGNLITIKNGILGNDAYDTHDGLQKLAAYSNNTYVNSGNLITPKVEAVIKKGNTQTPLAELGTKVTTDGTEVIEFGKIKGQTIQNCYPAIAKNSFSALNGAVENGYVVLQGTGDNFKNAFIPINKCLIRPNTQYTMVIDVAENTLTKELVVASNIAEDVFRTAPGTSVKVPSRTTGVHKFLVTSIEQFTNDTLGLRSHISFNETGKVRFRIMLLEGNHTSTSATELPFIEGIKSVGENDDIVEGKYQIKINSCGKNVINLDPVKKRVSGTSTHIGGWPNAYYYKNIDISKLKGIHSVGATHTVNGKPVKCKFLLSRNEVADVCKSHTELYVDIASKGDGYGVEITAGENCDFTNYNFLHVTPSNAENHGLTELDISISNIQIEEGATVTSYEKYKGCTQTVYLKEPLRSLTNEIYDEIVGNKVIRRVGRVILNGSENWQTTHNHHTTLKWHSLDNHIKLKGDNDSAARPIMCDKLTVSNANLYHVEVEGIFLEKTREGSSRIQINSTKSDIRAWLKQNPIILYYELANPIGEYLENVYEKESIKTYQLDTPLRSLPNGVKDEIKNGVLIRRCGEVLVTGKMHFSEFNNDRHGQLTYYAQTTFPNCKSFASILADKLTWRDDMWFNNNDAEGIHCHTNTTIQIRLSKAKIPNGTLQGFKNYLDNNPIKVIYELAIPIEIPLTEAKPQTANFSLQRQLAEGEWLRELPNGIKDTVERGKVKRRVKKVTLNGSESWREHTVAPNQIDTIAFYLADGSVLGANRSEVQIVSNLMDGKSISSYDGADTEGIAIGSTSAYAYIVKIKRNRINPVNAEGFKAWLAKNPITCLVALANPIDETLTDKNCNYYPCHDSNTYCGNMYVSDGRNNILNENKMPTEHPVVIETDFRQITGRAKVEDCAYKKCDDGYDTSYAESKTKNLISKSMYSNLWFMSDNPKIDHHDFTGLHYSIYNIKVKPDKVYYFSSDKILKRYGGKWLDIHGNFISYFEFPTGSSYGYTESVLPKSPPNACYLCMYIDNYGVLTSQKYNIQLEEGSTKTSYEDYIPTTKYFENTEENDIEDLRHQVSLTGFNYDKILNESFDKLLRGML